MSYSPADHSRLVDFLESRWGPNQRAWASPKLWEEFEPFTTGAVFQAIHQLFREGRRYAPNASELLDRVRTVQQARFEAGEDPRPSRDCASHVWSVLPEWEQEAERERQSKPDALRLAVCAICHTESWGSHMVESEGVKGTAA